MVKSPDWKYIETVIEKAINTPFSINNIRPVSGGCINSAYILEGENHSFFIKLNQPELLPMFKAEFAGLEEIAQSKTIKAPNVIACDASTDHAFLILEKMTFASENTPASELLGQQLAALHKTSQPFYGWHQNNTIGSTPQINHSSSDWLTFWYTNRLIFQLSLAEKAGYEGRLMHSGEQLSESLSIFFNDYTPQSSLLHGDLWSGNSAVTTNGEPVIFDPACYYGDRETDIAMTELFGGFNRTFYLAYNESFPLDSGYSVRKILYNLYHILNHLNLFGESYLSQAQQMIDILLSEIA